MTMDRPTEDRVVGAILTVCSTADELRECTDTAAMKAVLNRIWFDVHAATEAINRAEAETRAAALAKVRTFA